MKTEPNHVGIELFNILTLGRAASPDGRPRSPRVDDSSGRGGSLGYGRPTAYGTGPSFG